MHEFIIGIFNFVKSTLYFFRIVCVFCILMLLLYWIQNLTHATWAWIGFIKPFLDWLLEEANKIYSVSFDLWGAVFEFKYLSALIILVISSYVLKLVEFLVGVVENIYRGTRMLCKKTEQTLMNKQLHEDVKKEELKLTNYSLLIKTRIKKKFSHQEISINLDEQNKIMTDFIKEKTSKAPMSFGGAYMYQFNDFEHIDTVLDIMFKLLNSSAPLDYAITIQVGDNLNQLGKLLELEHYGQVTMAADTAYRYKYNTIHRYQTAQVGLFQTGEKTLEVHEFKPIL